MVILLLNALLVLIGGYLSGKLANRILALLLAALAMGTIINGFAELLQSAVEQLKEMGVIQR